MGKRENKKFAMEQIANTKKLIELRECGNADHLTNEKGEFVSQFPHGDGKISIGYLEDLCQWVFYHNDMTRDEKLTKILDVENLIQEVLNRGELSQMKINYKPTWSTKLKNECAGAEIPD